MTWNISVNDSRSNGSKIVACMKNRTPIFQPTFGFFVYLHLIYVPTASKVSISNLNFPGSRSNIWVKDKLTRDQRNRRYAANHARRGPQSLMKKHSRTRKHAAHSVCGKRSDDTSWHLILVLAVRFWLAVGNWPILTRRSVGPSSSCPPAGKRRYQTRSAWLATLGRTEVLILWRATRVQTRGPVTSDLKAPTFGSEDTASRWMLWNFLDFVRFAGRRSREAPAASIDFTAE